tara:strand:+ start:919 stop:1290 length:372 start_codon:yes stop_codon:yes gene_type:complete
MKKSKDIDYITPIKEKLEEELHIACNNFILIGSPRETPRYYNMSNRTHEQLNGGIFNIGKNKNVNKQYYLYIESTLKSELGFKIKITPDYYKLLWKTDGDFWEQFKKFRTEFLIKHYPAINPY